MARLAALMTDVEPTLPLLPLAHTTDWWSFREMMTSANPAIFPTKCKHYNQELSYFFYGKPSYRANSDIGAVSLTAFYSVCFLLNPKVLPPPVRVLPFDSGAMHIGLFEACLHPRMTVRDFEVTADINGAAKLVQYVYGSNQDYIIGKVRADLTLSALDLEMESLLAIVQGRSQTNYDERRSAVEIQFNEAVPLIHESVVAVILPQSLLDDSLVADFIEKRLRAHPLGYLCPHARPAEDSRSIYQCAADFYRLMGFF